MNAMLQGEELRSAARSDQDCKSSESVPRLRVCCVRRWVLTAATMASACGDDGSRPVRAASTVMGFDGARVRRQFRRTRVPSHQRRGCMREGRSIAARLIVADDASTAQRAGAESLGIRKSGKTRQRAVVKPLCGSDIEVNGKPSRSPEPCSLALERVRAGMETALLLVTLVAESQPGTEARGVQRLTRLIETTDNITAASVGGRLLTMNHCASCKGMCP